MIEQDLRTMVDKGMSTYDISRESGKAQSTVRHWLKKFDLKTTPYLDKLGKELICSRCEKGKERDEFYTTSKGKVTSYCKKCNTEYVTERIKKIKLRMIEYKGGECIDCKLTLENSHYSVFDFHHLNPKEKDLKFTKIKYGSWDKIKNEIDKCVLLCSNCHRLRHYKDASLV